MARTAEIILDGQTYTVRAFNIEQIERVMASPGSFAVLRIALERSEPPVAKDAVSELEPTMVEIRTALETVMKLSGLEIPTSPPA